MTAKEYMSRVIEQNRKVDDLIKLYNELRAFATRTTSQISGMPHGGGTSDKVGDCVARIVDLSRNIDTEQDKLVDLKDEISQTICKVNDTQCRELLHMRYVDCMEFDDIASKMGLSYNHTKNRLHDRAINYIQHIVIRT